MLYFTDLLVLHAAFIKRFFVCFFKVEILILVSECQSKYVSNKIRQIISCSDQRTDQYVMHTQQTFWWAISIYVGFIVLHVWSWKLVVGLRCCLNVTWTPFVRLSSKRKFKICFLRSLYWSESNTIKCSHDVCSLSHWADSLYPWPQRQTDGPRFTTRQTTDLDERLKSDDESKKQILVAPVCWCGCVHNCLRTQLFLFVVLW